KQQEEPRTVGLADCVLELSATAEQIPAVVPAGADPHGMAHADALSRPGCLWHSLQEGRPLAAAPRDWCGGHRLQHAWAAGHRVFLLDETGTLWRSDQSSGEQAKPLLCPPDQKVTRASVAGNLLVAM